jgi:hypothetical protein
MADSPKTPTTPPRDPLPPIYPIPLIEVACRALEVALKAIEQSKDVPRLPSFDAHLLDIGNSSLRIIKDGLASHEREAKEGRSRG